ncbi:MAG: Asp-tRNA(Asn)/Glu-tRNA(Gln) amidotransferase subunit GatB [Alphaproteobacteria bacterium]|jgi:aspartyl-tRNA(Asn)/glutamyl-tRNA(Gln) amidotransferase subunit B|nr:Asp-tRNA(Asn)/Glu-tRNA(Gln) amidotransferase subunit GatB [Alphaproteobacteria bacterium]MBT5390302.1 Asp-tRNA(Asn)/Glu-tRNA(Gln) amidotransferase subunit GatB [Alphaproteobacteria bacterium]MBT5540298.1 Asp-tRNA(Asn)/Glu-tRNA(Gln) amidotransferase subunit GatB [Alphaproteobacteria bacterium]MBT5654738.1 Asp-tRNA(Asn)/Glu-tRNA(Gln) amidotransferase subunit GatB [Alphaproteobacteria bacterium]
MSTQAEKPRYLIESETGPWEVVIGMEVHAQISSASKLFSGASTKFAGEPNDQVSLVDAAFPGMLPVINGYCVEQAVKTGLGLNAKINLKSIFDRKNYFYADLPAGYQISQYKDPIVGEGYLDIDLKDDKTQRIGIERLHLEQDAGKSFHDQHPEKSYIDLNRAGVALMEIVSRPDIRSPEEAMAFMRKIRTILRYIGSSDGNMDEGSMRADVNVSLHRPGTEFGIRAEIKNVNSIRFVGQAVECEIERQIDLLESGQEVVQETRLFDAKKGETRSMRSKEEAHDYRYFPDPDLLPLVFSQGFVDEIREELPELPDAKKARFIKDYVLSPYEAGVLVAEATTARFYEEGVAALKDKQKGPRSLATWVVGDFFAALNKEGLSIEQSKVSAENLAGMINLLLEDVISGRIAKDVFIDMWATGKTASEIVEEKGLVQITDTKAIEGEIARVMEENAEKVAEYRQGKEKLFGFFVGQIMKAMKGKGNPKIINEILQSKLKG